MYRIIDRSKYWAAFSIALCTASVVVWFMWGLNLSIDFTGGTSMQVQFANAEQRPTAEEMHATLNELGLAESQVQTAGESDMLLKLQHVSNEQRQQILNRYADRGIVETQFVSIGPALGSELKRKSTVAIIMVLVAIIAYISYAFRKVSNGPVPSWVFGVAAIIALMHDIFIPVGIFVILGHFKGVQVDALFVTALLTVLGFSVHDTIVVFDRIREGLKDRAKKSFREIVNASVNVTLARSINTSLSTLIVLVALYLFGGESVQHFVLALIIGIISGTYSSIFIASPLLLLGQRLLKRG
jgi:preprotein translocase subunit SecF